jgi:hypothetical protein
MANSLRAKLSKLRHDGHITDNEYQAFLKKIDGHDREIYNKAIDDFRDKICEKYTAEERKENYRQYCCNIKQELADIAEQLKS